MTHECNGAATEDKVRINLFVCLPAAAHALPRQMSDAGGKLAASVARDGRSVGVAPLACRHSFSCKLTRHASSPARAGQIASASCLTCSCCVPAAVEVVNGGKTQPSSAAEPLHSCVTPTCFVCGRQHELGNVAKVLLRESKRGAYHGVFMASDLSHPTCAALFCRFFSLRFWNRRWHDPRPLPRPTRK